jgi:hypothetical protein
MLSFCFQLCDQSHVWADLGGDISVDDGVLLERATLVGVDEEALVNAVDNPERPPRR